MMCTAVSDLLCLPHFCLFLFYSSNISRVHRTVYFFKKTVLCNSIYDGLVILFSSVSMLFRDGSRLLKRGARPVIIVDVGLPDIFTLIVCEAHRDAKHASTTGIWGIPPGNFEKLHLLRLNLRRVLLVIYQPLIFLWIQVHITS